MTPDLLEILEEKQVKQALDIAQYDVQAAARYSQFCAARNRMICPICGSSLRRSRGGRYMYVCSNSRRGKHGNQ